MRFLREALALAGLAFQWALVATSWKTLPERVPTHYGFSGQADAYGDKSSLLLLPLLAGGLYAMLTALSFFPQRFNYPVQVNDENRERVQALALEMVGWLKAELTWCFAYIEWTTVRAAQGLADGLGRAFLPIVLGITAATILIGILRIRRAA